MHGPVNACWAKLAADSAGRTLCNAAAFPLAWHPLVHHSADVAATFRALLELPKLRNWLAALAGDVELVPLHVDRLTVFAGLHDVGKVNLGFRSQAHPDWRRPRAGHVGPLIGLLQTSGTTRQALHQAIRYPEMLRWVRSGDDLDDLLLTVFAHHGRPVSPDGSVSMSLWKPAHGVDPIADARALADEVFGWLPDISAEGPPLPAAPPFQHGLNGLLTLADWIASDVNFFPFTDELETDRFTWARDRARDVLVALGIATHASRRSLGPRPPAFVELFGHEPRDAQAKILVLPIEAKQGSVAVLEAETGAGKTEAALMHFLRLFQRGAVDGLYFALPTRTAATQIHQRVRRAVERAFPEPAVRPSVVLGVPGYFTVDDEHGLRLAGFEVLWPDRPESWRPRAWAAEHSKRYLAGAVVVGTIDQVLLSALQVSHAQMRDAALARHLLVIDEVHASDAYMTAVTEDVLARHATAGGHALLMSATLGSAARDRLLNAGRAHTPASLAVATAVPYPLLTARASGASAHWQVTIEPPPPRRIVVRLVPIAAEPGAVAKLALEAARRDARALVIRNTVRDCVATQLALESLATADDDGDRTSDRALLFECCGLAAPHHARYARADRQALDRALEERFGRGAARVGIVAIATQTVQQSLDIDADLLVTDLCPLDVLLQRLGRLHRHARTRPAGYEMPEAIILVPADRDLGRFIGKDGVAAGPHGFGRVYEDLRIIEASWAELERASQLEIPTVSRALVEVSTHPEALTRIVADRCEAWKRHSQAMEGIRLGRRRIAQLNMIDRSKPFPETSFADDDPRIGSRLGAADRIAELPHPLPVVFRPADQPAELIQQIPIPRWMAQGIAPDAAVQSVERADGALTFQFGERRFVYDRLGLRTRSFDSVSALEEDD